MPLMSKSTKFMIPSGSITKWSGGGGSTLTSELYANNGFTGFNDPDFRVTIARGGDAGHPYTRSENSILIPALYTQILDNNLHKPVDDVTYFRGLCDAITTIPPQDAVDDIALKRLKSKLASEVGDFKALVPLAELNETRSLIRTTAAVTTDVLEALIDIKRLKPRAAAAAASRAWLQFSFAISPTISDLHSAVSSVQSYIDRKNRTLRLYGQAENNWKSRKDSLRIQACGAGNWKSSFVEYEHAYKVRYKFGFNLQMKAANNYGLDDHFGLSFGNLPSVGWELIPFSWVADYFGTVGAFLEDAFTSPPGITLYGCKTRKYTVKQSSDVFLETPHKILMGGERQSISAKTFLMNRQILASLPHRALRFKTSDEIGTNSVNRVLNLASILLSKGK